MKRKPKPTTEEMVAVIIPIELEEALHKHQCSRCGLIWEHGEECVGDEYAHTCLNCGATQSYRYYGRKPATIFHGLKPKRRRKAAA